MHGVLAAFIAFATLFSASEAAAAQRTKLKQHSGSNASFRRRHRSRYRPVEAQGPTVPATGTRFSAPKTLSRTSARGALPDLTDWSQEHG